jgi:ABC-type dipeptide/oligopeptide/nickel transport system permease component
VALGRARRGVPKQATSKSLFERTLLVLVAVLMGLVIGQAAGILAVLARESVAATFITGGATFAGTVTLMILIESALGLLRPDQPKPGS